MLRKGNTGRGEDARSQEGLRLQTTDCQTFRFQNSDLRLQEVRVEARPCCDEGDEKKGLGNTRLPKAHSVAAQEVPHEGKTEDKGVEKADDGKKGE